LGSKVGDAAPAPSKTDDTAKLGTGEAKKAAPAPAPSVWNGKHAKIIEVSDKSDDARSPSPASVKDDNNGIKALQSLVSVQTAKEDETTNSTAGSSTTNSTSIADETPSSSAVEVKVVTTTHSSESSDNKDHSEGAENAGVKGNRQGGPGKNGNPNNSRRVGNNGAKGGRGNNNSRGNNSLPRTNSAGGNGRRRAANGNNSGDRPVCHFFLQGRCTRGDACTFKHTKEPAGDAPSYPVRRSGSNNALKKSSQPKKMVPVGAPYIPNKRTFDPFKARAIQMAKEAQDLEDRSNYASKSDAKPTVKIITDEKKSEEDVVAKEEVSEEPPFFSIDVECIATGYGSCARGINDGCGNEGRNAEGVPANQYNDRSHRYPGRIAMVDSDGQVLADMVIRPPQDGKGVVSYLTPLTGLTQEMCLGPDAKSLEDAVAVVKGLLPENAVLVGQAIDHDEEWLGLVAGKDFGRAVDISEIFRQRMPASLGLAADALKQKEAEGAEQIVGASDEELGFATRYRHFSLRHVCINLLGTDIQSGVHDPIVDARYSLTLFHKYRNSSTTQLRIVRDGLHRAPITPGFAAENTPVIDGVCVSAAGYPYKRAARRILRWYTARKASIQQQES
jgi:hypothetical protein